MKKIIVTLMLLAVAMTAGAFDFSVVTPQGQTLYYTIVSGTNVKVVAPSGNSWDFYESNMPEGSLQIPATVVHEGTTYTVVAIDNKAFAECSGITEVHIPSSVTSIGIRAFANASAMTSLTIEEGLQSIGSTAFISCTSLETITLPSTLTHIGLGAFNNSGYYNNTDNWSSEHTLSIGHWLIQVSNTVSDELVVEGGTVGIADNAFYYCRFLHGVTLPASLRYVGSSVFKECEVLDTVRVRATTPPSMGDECFVNAPVKAVVVPCGSLAAYRAVAPWNTLPLLEAACPVGIESVDGAMSQQVAVFVFDGGIEVHGAERNEAAVYDMMGRRVAWVAQASNSQRISLPAAGLYVLRLSDGQAVKVTYFK